MFLQPSKRPSRSRRASRGFTLIELMVVVLIIGVTAVLATPAINSQMRERRARDTAQRIALLYGNARMRALARGAAVVVRYRQATGFSVVESIQGTTVAAGLNAASVTCATQPGLGCLTNDWADTGKSQLLKELEGGAQITLTAKDQGDAAVTQMDICFSPGGRTFISFDGNPPRTAMVGATTVDVQRTGMGVGLKRTVAILPNGMARMAL